MYEDFLIERHVGLRANAPRLLIDPVCWVCSDGDALEAMVAEQLIPVLGNLLGDGALPSAIALVAARADWRTLRSARMRSMERTLVKRRARAVVVLDTEAGTEPLVRMVGSSRVSASVRESSARIWVRRSAQSLSQASPIVRRAVHTGSLALVGWCHSRTPLQSSVFRVDDRLARLH